ncbi:MAG: hypothetical protein V4619_15780 [Bacteroidota bacterium]
MKKALLYLILFLTPLFTLAQDALIYEDFAEKVRDISTIHYSDKLSIMMINIDNDNFDVLAINDEMGIVWKTSLTGYAMSISKFNGKILAIAATEHSAIKGPNNIYNGFLLNPQTGEKLIEKKLFEDSAEFQDYPQILISNETFWGIGVRQSNSKRKLHVGMPGLLALISIAKMQNDVIETQDLDVIQFNDKLDPTNNFKPVVPPKSMFLQMTANDKGDVFIAWLDDTWINVHRYEYGKKDPTGIVKADIALQQTLLKKGANVALAPSSANRNLVYFGLFASDDGKNTLFVGSLDVSTGKKNMVNEVFTRDHAKELEKAFIKPNKKINDADLGASGSLRLRYFKEVNGVLIAAMSARSYSSSNYGTYITERSVLINAYDAALGLKFQQFLPARYIAPKPLEYGIYARNNKLQITAVDASSGLTPNYMGLYGTLDLSTGQWDNIIRLSKKKIDGTAFPNGGETCWFDTTFALPYMKAKGLTGNKYDVLLQQNSY